MKSFQAILTALICALSVVLGSHVANADAPAGSEQRIGNSQQFNATESPTAEGSTAASSSFAPITANCDCDHCGWDIALESLFLWRDNHAPSSVAGDFDMGVGPRIIVTREVNDEWAWDAEYFGVYSMTASATQSGYFQASISGFSDFGDSLSNPSNPSEPNPFSGFTDFGDLVGPVLSDRYDTQQRYESSINNFELNAVRKWQAFSLLAGFRYLRFEEQYQTTAKVRSLPPIPAFPSDDSQLNPIGSLDQVFRTTDNTENNLIGGQLGLRWRHDAGRVSCEATGKAGVFGNVYKISDEPMKSNTAFIGDFNFSAGLHVNDIWSIRAGYSLLWITGVALAPRQVLTSVMFPTQFHPDDRLFLHGANVGLEAAW